MTNESIRRHCLGLPHVTEVVQWGSHLLFKVGGRMFAMIDLDGHSCGLRCTPDGYAELVERPDIVPASHNMSKYHWVTLESLAALPEREFKSRLTTAYEVVRAGLPKAVREALDAGREASVPQWTPKKRRAVTGASRRRTGRPS
jgi:predicted DNA-binding protein (MmcQ/YjbR family)